MDTTKTPQAEQLSMFGTADVGAAPPPSSASTRLARKPSAAARGAVAALLPEIPGANVLRDRGATDAALASLLRRLARRGATCEGCSFGIERRTAVVVYGLQKRLKGPALTAAVRALHRIPTPEAASPTPKPDIGRISEPQRLPTRRWGYRSDGVWWSSTSSKDRDGENGFHAVQNPVTIGRLDEWARTRFTHLYPDQPGPGSPATQARSRPVTAASVQGDLLLHVSAAAADDTPRNFRISGTEEIGHGSPRKKVQANLAAIRILRTLEDERRAPTPDEQAVLSRYCGWGALPNVFNDGAAEWHGERAQLRNLLNQAELTSAEASTPNAHFTSLPVVEAIFGILNHLGFRGGKILEPGAGVGHFIGSQPSAWIERTRWTAVESDAITGRILAMLYPREDVRVTRLEHSRVVDGRYDAVVGNVPFGSYTIFDRVHNPGNDLRVHDYFIVRSLAALRPGGLLVAITSRGTLDKTSPKVRERIAATADLLGAIRLPNTAFQANAGTKVTADILILRKRSAGEHRAGPAWLNTAPVMSQDGPIAINEYFAAHPYMMLGEMRLIRGPRAEGEPTLVATPGTNLGDALRSATRHLPTNVYAETGSTERKVAESDFLTKRAQALREGTFTQVAGRLYQKLGGTLVAAATLGRTDQHRVTALSEICTAVRHVLHSQNDELPAGEQDAARSELNRLYDRFVATYGWINTEKRTQATRSGGSVIAVRRPNLQAFRKDPDWPLVAALEIYDPDSGVASKAPIFTQRVVRPTVTITDVDDVTDALLVCLDRHAKVDLDVIGRLWGRRSVAEVKSALAGRIYLDPQSGRWNTADAYLSGPVRTKLANARSAAETDPHYLANVAALEAVQPADLEPSQIDCGLGASWLPTDVIACFLRELLGKVAHKSLIDVVHFARDAVWKVTAPKELRESIEATRTWGTDRAHAVELLEESLNQRERVIYDYRKENGKTVRVVNAVATVDAQEKQKAIAEAFQAWVWNDGVRARHLLSIYNSTFNGSRLQTFDGSHLRFPGASAAITLDPHQLNTVWRILSAGNTLVAHCVGAGKTYLAAAAGMKLRQVGLARKVLHVVMNHMLEQYSRETLQLFPNARLLVAGSDDLAGDGRRLFLSRVAEGDFDAIVITHGAFGKLPMSRAFEEDFLRQEIQAYRALLTACGREQRATIKQINSSLKQMNARLEALIARENKDEFITFEELGVDALFVDEIQQFKNLHTPTKIADIPTATRPSQRATDLLMKLIYLDGIRPGRGFVGMTGTPITNTIAEMHVMARLHAPHLLSIRGIGHFDGFAGTFIRRVNAAELAPDGRSYRVRTRFHYTNMAELTVMFRTFADVQMMRSYYEAPDGEPFEGGTLELPIPRLEGGKPQVIAAAATPELRTFVDGLVQRAKNIRDGLVNRNEDIMLLVVGDGRKAALDMRLINPNARDWPGSKVNLCAAEVHRTWAETADRRLTQLVFTDLSRPRSDGRFSVCNDLHSKLIALGIPEGEIAFAQDATSDARRAMLFKAVREGRIRVLIGSTETMGTGTNVQDLLVRIHHLDAPWRPSDIEQRDGRMMRRGNRNAVCVITRYVTEESFDAYVWNLLHYKLTMINRIMLGDLSIRRVSDGDAVELSYAQLKAIASGDPLVLEKAAVDQRLIILSRSRRAFQDSMVQNRIDQVEIPRRVAAQQTMEAGLLADLATRRDTRGDHFEVSLAIPGGLRQGDSTYDRFVSRPQAAGRLRELVLEFVESQTSGLLSNILSPQASTTIGYFGGFAIRLSRRHGSAVELALQGNLSYAATIDIDGSSPAGNLQTLENLPRRIEPVLDATRQRIAYLQQQMETLSTEATEFSGEGEYRRLLQRQREIDGALQPAAAAARSGARHGAASHDHASHDQRAAA